MRRDLLLDVAVAARSAVLPVLGSVDGRRSEGRAVGGDPTFALDERAEAAAERVLEAAASTEDLAWYTEDRGLLVRGRAPTRIVVLDPVDGTRPAGAGLESACVSVAEAPFSEDATLGDVTDGVVLEIRTGTLFRARRGTGVRIVQQGETRPPSLAATTELAGAFWCYGLRGRPVAPSAIALGELVDATSVGGGTFDLGSASYALTRVVTGQLDAYVDHGQRLIDEIPETRRLFQEITQGAVLNNSPYDVAAALLVCEEAGVTVTDAAGGPLHARPLVGSGPEHQVSTLAACTPELHAVLLAALDRGMTRLRRTVERNSVDALSIG